jgi:hypothetical protein
MHLVTPMLLLFLLPGVVGATVYQCRNRDGILFLTNDRDKIPPGCDQVSELIGEKAAASSQENSVMRDHRPSSPPPRSQTATDQAGETRSNSTTPTGQVGGLSHKKEMAIWLGLAQKMMSRYNALQNSNESPAEKAEKLNRLENNLRTIRDSLDQSPLSAEEAAEIEAQLPRL